MKAANCNMERKWGLLTTQGGPPGSARFLPERELGGRHEGGWELPWTVWPHTHTHTDTLTHTHSHTHTHTHTHTQRSFSLVLPSFPPTPKPGPPHKPAVRKGSYSEDSVTNMVLLLFSTRKEVLV